MTSQPPPATQPYFVDLRLEHERVQKQFRLGKIAALSILGVFGLLMGAAVALANPSVGGVAAGVLILLGVGALFLGLIALSAAKERRQAGPASNGPSSFGQVVTSAPGPQVWESVSSALRAQKFMAPGRPIDPQTVVSSRSLSMVSWGETLTIRIVATADGRGLVTAWSRPAYPLQWLDYGRNRGYANAVLNAIPDATPVA
ncbi:MAG: hypothetical protein ABIP45_09840 [Knoellia sp.]